MSLFELFFAPQPAETNFLLVQPLSKSAVLPCRGSEGAAGYDLASAVDITIPALGKGVVPTDLAIATPPGTYGRIAPRSGLAIKNFIATGAGVVDSDFRGNVGVVIFNHSTSDFQIQKGDRIAQLLLEYVANPAVLPVCDLPKTPRGSAGFGSTGLASPPLSGEGGRGVSTCPVSTPLRRP